jgi:hypothetical protein
MVILCEVQTNVSMAPYLELKKIKNKKITDGECSTIGINISLHLRN